MTVQIRFGLIFGLLLLIAVLFAGCTDESSDTVVTTPPTATPLAVKYSAGDIIAKTADGGESQLYVITRYDQAKDEYERAWIYRNADGTWGHFIDSRVDRSPRTIIEKVYPVRVARVTVSAIPVVTPTYVTATPTLLSGDAPVVTGISPTSGAQDASVAVTISGTDFRTGAVPKLFMPGSPSVTGSAVKVSSTAVECVFNLDGLETGSYNVVVTNPDGQSSILLRAFAVGDAAPIITSVSPSKLTMNETESLVINGQNFKEGVKVVLLKGSSEIPCVSPVSTYGTHISCDLDLYTKRNAQISFGEWDIRVTNIEGSQSGTWTKKVTIVNATSLDA